MGTKMRTRPIARKGEGAPSRKHKREMTKSPIRLNCQRKTRGAANRAAKELAGKPREGGYNQGRTFERQYGKKFGNDEPLADWERALLHDNV